MDVDCGGYASLAELFASQALIWTDVHVGLARDEAGAQRGVAPSSDTLCIQIKHGPDMHAARKVKFTILLRSRCERHRFKPGSRQNIIAANE